MSMKVGRLLLVLVFASLGAGGIWFMQRSGNHPVQQSKGAAAPGDQIPPGDGFAAFREEAARGTMDTALLGTADIPDQIRVGGVSISARNGHGAVLVQGTGRRVVLTDSFQIAALAGSGNSLVGGRHGGASISAAPGMPDISGNIIEIAGGRNRIDLVPPIVGDHFNLPTGIKIAGFAPETDHLNVPGVAEVQPIGKTVLAGQTAPSPTQVARRGQTPIPVRLLTATRAAPIEGRTLDFTHEAILLNIGHVGDGTPDEVVEALNAVYRATTKAGSAEGASPAEAAGESLVIIGDTPAGSVIYQCGVFKIIRFGGQARAIPYGLGVNEDDHKIPTASLHHLATLKGVSANSMTARDFE